MSKTEFPAAKSASVSPVALEEISSRSAAGEGAWLRRQPEWIKGVKVDLQVVVGRATVSVEKLFAMKVGDAVELEALVDAPVEVHLENKPIARGTLVVVGERFGVRITEIDEVSF